MQNIQYSIANISKLFLVSVNCLFSQQFIPAVDTIPFRLGPDNRIHMQGTINNEQPIDFIFDTGAEGIWLYKSGVAKTTEIKFHGQSTIIGVGGEIHSEYSLNNTFRMANRLWENRTVDYSGIQLHNSDGVIGYRLFEENIIELNFDTGQMIVHDTLFSPDIGYTHCRLMKRNNNYFIEVILNTGVKKFSVWLHFDTGSSGSLNIHNGFVADQNLYGTMKKLGEHKSSGVGPDSFTFERVMLPSLELAGVELKKVPISLEIQSKNTPLPFGIIGTDILKRFNIIIDFHRSAAYLKPNSLFHSFFRQ